MDGQIAEDLYLKLFKDRFIRAVDQYKLVHGEEPPVYEDAFEFDSEHPNCIRGYTETQCAAMNGDRLLRRVNIAYRDILVHMDMIKGLKNGSILPYKLGAIGYQILGQDIPEKYRHNITDLYNL